MEIAHLDEDGIFSELLSVENYKVAYQAQPCNALERPYMEYEGRRGRQFRGRVKQSMLSLQSHISLSREKV